jgi:choline transporter-like protein 2/4/5
LNNFLKCFTYCCRCCLACCNRFIKFLTKNAYIQLALTSKNFCSCAINGFLLCLRNIMMFTLTEGMGNLFCLLGTILVSLLNTLAAYAIIITWPDINDSINSVIAPLAAIFAISYIVSCLYFGIYSIAASAILQCFLLDLELSKSDGKEGAYGEHRPKEL